MHTHLVETTDWGDRDRSYVPDPDPRPTPTCSYCQVGDPLYNPRTVDGVAVRDAIKPQPLSPKEGRRHVRS